MRWGTSWITLDWLIQRCCTSAERWGTSCVLRCCTSAVRCIPTSSLPIFLHSLHSIHQMPPYASVLQPHTASSIAVCSLNHPTLPFSMPQTILWQPTRPTIVLLKKTTKTHLILHSRARDSNSVAHDTVATALFLIFVDLCGFFIVYPLVFIDFQWFTVPNPPKTIQNPSKSFPNYSKTS